MTAAADHRALLRRAMYDLERGWAAAEYDALGRAMQVPLPTVVVDDVERPGSSGGR